MIDKGVLLAQETLRIESKTASSMMKETATVLRELNMGTTAKILHDQAERLDRATVNVIGEKANGRT